MINITMYKAGDAITLAMLYLLLFLVGFLTDVCQSCEAGYYSSDGVCQGCPNRCASCSSASLCTSCNAGYYGETCSNECPPHCHSNMCNQTSGQCLSCIAGYFNSGNNSCIKCPDNCAKCNSKQFCFTCRDSYRGEICQSICTSCKPGTRCDKNTGYCLSDCLDGFSGELCDTPCDSNCKSCHRLKNHECISCASDRHGPSCNESCPRACDLNTCDVRNGSCTSGCIDGYWGEMCEQNCSRQCNNQVCYQSNGECKDGCIDEFSGMDCSTRKSSISLALIGGIIACIVFIVSVLVFSIYIFIIRKRKIKWCNSSLGERIHHMLCTSDKTTIEPEAEPLKPLNGSQVNLNDDKEKMLEHTREQENVNEGIFQQITIKAEKENESKATGVYISIQGNPQHEINVNARKTTLPIQLKASPEKEETLPLIHVTAKPEEMDNRKANNETFDIEKPLTTYSNENENTDKAEDKPLTDTQIKKGYEDTYIDRLSEKQTEERDIVRNTEENENSIFEDERVSKTSLHENTSTISKRPALDFLKKDENDETNTFPGVCKDNNGQKRTFNDNREHLSVNASKSENMKTNDEATYTPIQVTSLAQYVENISDYEREFQKLSEVANSMDASKTPAKGHMNTLQTSLQRSPVTLKGEETATVDAYFISAIPYATNAYISYMGPTVISKPCRKEFWKTVVQNKCDIIVMLTTESCLPERKCTCSQKSCSERYGDVTVSCKGETKFGSYTVRMYTINTEKMTERSVQRLHFSKWPPFGLPDDDVSSFVDFVKYANNYHSDGPTMVYCSSGKEHTGVYIALDILTKQGSDKGCVDIFGCVRHLREQRENMIEVCEQYKFLHKALAISLSN